MSYRKSPRIPAVLGTAVLLLAVSLGQAAVTGQVAHAQDLLNRSSTPHSEANLPSVPAAADLRTLLSGEDKLATLRTLHMVLGHIEDGATYVWHRGHGRLSGAFRPTRSFRDNDGRLCRHIVMQLVAGLYGRKSEGIACRSQSGQWHLEG